MKREGCFAVISDADDGVRHCKIKICILNLRSCIVRGNVPREIPRIINNILSVFLAYCRTVTASNIGIKIINIGVIEPGISNSSVYSIHIALSSRLIKLNITIYYSIVITLCVIVCLVVIYKVCIENTVCKALFIVFNLAFQLSEHYMTVRKSDSVRINVNIRPASTTITGVAFT